MDPSSNNQEVTAKSDGSLIGTSSNDDVESGEARTEGIVDSQTSADDGAFLENAGHEDPVKRWLSSRQNFRNSIRLSHAMENFLYMSLSSDDGGFRPPPSLRPDDHRVSNGSGSIFETSFDLTEERLRRIFNLFDKDLDGSISFDEMKNGLKYNGLGSFSEDDATFDQLVRYLDKDNSGNISFEEFSEGIRLLMLKSLLRTAVASHGKDDNIDDAVTTEIFDYNATRLERSVLEGFGQVTEDLSLSLSVTSLNVMDFFFADRPKWIDVRWVNITGEKASHIMKMIALRFRLHPLALEDALECDNQRAKAESYTGHYFIMVPLFYLEYEDEDSVIFAPGETHSRRRKIVAAAKRWWRRLQRQRASSEPNSNTKQGPGEERPRVSAIGLQMTSIFVTMPTGKTVITFNKQDRKKGAQLKIDSRHHTRLTDCWARVQSELKKSYSKLRQYDGQYLCYSLLDQAVDVIGPIVKEIGCAISDEKQTLRERNYREMGRIHNLRDELKTMARRIKPFKNLLMHVIEDKTISPGPTLYLRDVLDNLENYDEEVKNLIASCESADEEAEKFQRAQMDSTLYTLTVISATFLPAQFLTGVWGMNFLYMPELDEEYGYRMFWGLAVLLMVSMLLFLNCGRLTA